MPRKTTRSDLRLVQHWLELLSPGGEGGIRTLDTGVSPYNGLANRRLQPLGHLSDSLAGDSLADYSLVYFSTPASKKLLLLDNGVAGGKFAFHGAD